jgi:hypothetical protein
MGGEYRKLGDVPRARPLLQQALAIFEQIESPFAQQARQALEELGKG